MIKADSILNLMVTHHGFLETLLTVFKDSLGKGAEETAKTLDKFQWELEKHIFSEEKVIFSFCKGKDAEVCDLIKKLEQDHTVMLEMLGDLKDDLLTKAEKDSVEFREFMAKHRKIEEKNLYPRLDQELPTAAKEEIIARVNEVSIKK
jgi:iron-sulfur cluster repair protein YtfE (RIC family)